MVQWNGGEEPQYDGALPSDPLQALTEIGYAVAKMLLEVQAAVASPMMEREIHKQAEYISLNMRVIAEAVDPRIRAYRDFERSMRSIAQAQRPRRPEHPTLNLDWNVKDDATAEPPC